SSGRTVMQRMIKKRDRAGSPIIVAGDDTVSDIYFDLVELGAGETHIYAIEGFESAAVVLSGSAEIAVAGVSFASVGQRPDIWSGHAEAVYAGRSAKVEIVAGPRGAEIAVAGGRCEEDFEPFRVSAAEGEAIEVGSAESKSQRRLQ